MSTVRLLSGHTTRPVDTPSRGFVRGQALNLFMAVCEGGSLEHRAAEWGLISLRGGSGIVTCCEVISLSMPSRPGHALLTLLIQVLLRDVVGNAEEDDNGEKGLAGRPCGAMILTGTMAYKCLVKPLPKGSFPALDFIFLLPPSHPSHPHLSLSLPPLLSISPIILSTMPPTTSHNV